GIADELRLAVHLKAGEKAKLYLTDDPSKVTWSSMDESTVTVSADGQVTGVKKGLAIVQAELDGQTYQIYVRVNG
ncbi:Ig-like domain-containing protein, partial [Aminipila sp.]|uniref:Ig-like domain-containing protein n=1 Tax=Aminipila sp. TaxID=2060095 RepID=UPI00289D0627